MTSISSTLIPTASDGLLAVAHTALLFGLGVIALAASTAAGLVMSARRARPRETSAATTACLATR